MSADFDEEFDLVKALRESQALEMVEETDNGWQTKVVECALSNAAATEIESLRNEIKVLRKQLGMISDQKTN